MLEIFDEKLDGEDMWSVFLLLLRRDLYPDIRIKILERIDKRFDFIMSCESLRAIATAGVSSFGYSGTILIARRQTEKDMCRGFLQRSLVPLNARIALAQALLSEDLPRAKELFQNVIPILLEITDERLNEQFEMLFSRYNIFPEAKLLFLRKALSRSSPPALVLRKYAHYLMEGEGLVLQDPELAKLLLEQAEIEEAALDLTLDLKNMSLTSQ